MKKYLKIKSYLNISKNKTNENGNIKLEKYER